MVTLFVEGGGDSNDLKSKCREAFRSIIEKRISKHPLRIMACGNRKRAFDNFERHIKNGNPALLLVDSETLVQEGLNPWQHLKKNEKDKWTKPDEAKDEDCHLMVVCMETWFLADPKVLSDYFGAGFHEKALPSRANIEETPKEDVLGGLKKATKPSNKEYSKGSHSFDILKNLDPNAICTKSVWARRFFDELGHRLKK